METNTARRGWVFGLAVLAALLVVLAGLWYAQTWTRYQRPYTVTASPNDAQYFIDDLAEPRDTSWPLDVTIYMADHTLTLSLMRVEDRCLVMLTNFDALPTGARDVVYAYVEQNGLTLDEDSSVWMDFEIPEDRTFSDALRTLIDAFAEYTGDEVWQYVWTGNEFDLPDHLEVSGGLVAPHLDAEADSGGPADTP
jgi:hypothetical protein